MSAVNKGKVWVVIAARRAPILVRKLDQRRVRPSMIETQTGRRKVQFDCPRGMTMQDAIMVMADCAPQDVEIYAS